MKIKATTLIPYLIVIVPLALVLSVSFFISSFYINKVTNYFEQAKENSIHDYINLQKAKSELKVNQLILLFEYTNNRVAPAIKKELKSKVDIAYNIAHEIDEKYKKKKKLAKQRVKDALYELVSDNEYDTIFITDYRANAILLGSHLEDENIAQYLDKDSRSIVYEEIQKVRRHGEGYIKSVRNSGDKEIIYVKSLDLYDWYIGSNILVKNEREKVKANLLEMIKSMPVDKSEFVGVYQDGKKLYQSDDAKIHVNELNEDGEWHKNQVKDYYFYSRYFKEFNWTLVYGFDTTMMSHSAQKKHLELKKMLNQELEFVFKVSGIIIFLITVLSLLFSLKINKIFKNYQKEVESREKELAELNNSLFVRVAQEVKSHREKEKMLTQSAKMAEMGDMLSMIAHQWRQPLNQASYVLMNIESAYEYNELTKEYLESKIKEGNELLEFMSMTIDDFKNYFAPDKSKELVAVDAVIKTAISLIKKSLESDGVEIMYAFKSTTKISLYKNEFIQVVLNLLKNSKDVFQEKEILDSKIMIRTYEKNSKVLIEFIDNGGGIDAKIIEKIFDPYFSTKESKNGTGLGLYMSKMIIEGHLHATIKVENRDDGACFSIAIPI